MLLGHKRAALLFVALAGAAILVACGGGGGEGGGSTPAAPATFTVGGTVSGIAVPGLVLQNNQVGDITVSANGTFAFPAQSNGSAYAVTVRTNPSGGGQQQTCSVSSGSGTLSGSNVTSVAVSCVTTACPQLTQPLPTSSAAAIVAYDFVSSSTAAGGLLDVKYKVRFQNTEPGLKAVTAQASAATGGPTVADGSAAFGDVGIYTTAVSSDDITLRQAAACAAAAPALTWSVASTVEAASQAGLLQGSSDRSAIASVTDINDGDFALVSEVTNDPRLGNVIRVHIEIKFKPSSTIGQVNSVLRRINGRIVSGVIGSLWVTVRVPDPGSISALQAVVNALRQESVVAEADIATNNVFFAALPEGVPPATAYPPSANYLFNELIAIRAPAAWNAARAMSDVGSRPQVVVADDFASRSLLGGNGFGGDIAVQVVGGSVELKLNPLAPKNRHGVNVVSAIANDFASTSFANGPLLAAIAPVKSSAPVQLRVVDLSRIFGTNQKLQQMVQSIRASPGKVIVNTSFGSCKDGTGADCNSTDARRLALRWFELLRGDQTVSQPALIEQKFIHMAAAGNDFLFGTPTKIVSAFTAAALTTDLVDSSGNAVPRASNIMVVESRDVSTYSSSTSSRVLCNSSFSNTGGHISSTGGRVELIGADDSATFITGGTSFASPQVASLAYYMWSVRPDLSVSSLFNRIVGSGIQPATCVPAPAPVVDAYGALLSLDETILATGPSLVPVRRAILNIDNDATNTFTVDDVLEFARQFAAAQAGAAPDYGRADLNGDGYTGGSGRVAFNLNANRDSVEAPIITDGLDVLVPPISRTIGKFNEPSLKDHEILCWYIYSPLYTGDAARTLAENALAANQQPACATTVAAAGAVRPVAAKGNHSFAVKADGTLWAVGANRYGELGTGDMVARQQFVQVLTNVKSVRTEIENTFALKTDGTLWAAGQVIPGTFSSTQFIQVLSDVVDMSGNYAVKADGSLWVYTGISQYAQVLTGVRTVSAGMSAGDQFAIVLRTDGTVWVRGANNNGQLGTGDTADRTTFVQVMTGAKAVAAGGFFSLVLKADNTLWATGENSSGQLGAGDQTQRTTFVQVSSGIKAIAAGFRHTMATRTDDQLLATGLNNYGQLGTGDSLNRSQLVPVLGNVLGSSAGNSHSLALRADGTLWGAGRNIDFELGLSGTADRRQFVQVLTGVAPPSQN